VDARQFHTGTTELPEIALLHAYNAALPVYFNMQMRKVSHDKGYNCISSDN